MRKYVPVRENSEDFEHTGKVFIKYIFVFAKFVK